MLFRKIRTSFPIALLITLISCSQKSEVIIALPLSEQQTEFEVYDSLTLDYLGNLHLMDISPDGKHFLIIDSQTDSIFVLDKAGAIQYQYLRKGEGPENYKGGRISDAQFISDTQYLLPATSGINQYDLTGTFQKKYQADFISSSSLMIPNSKKLWIKGDRVFALFPGRGADQWGHQGIKFQQNNLILEEFDLKSGEFKGIIPFPKESKFSSEEATYGSIFLYPVFNIKGDSLYLTFRNEPKIFTYSLDNLTNPQSVKAIPFPDFKEVISNEKKEGNSIDFYDFFQGNINSLDITEEGQYLLNYMEGLSKEEYDQAYQSADGDMNKIWEEGLKFNTGGTVLFDGISLSPIIEKSAELGNMEKFISKDEIWFSLNTEDVEKDYSVFYKARIRTIKE